MVRNDPDEPATIEFEFRDWPTGAKLKAGPKLRLLPGGNVHVPKPEGGWESAGSYPIGVWVQVEVIVPQGGDEVGPWAVRLRGPDGELLSRGGLPPLHSDFHACNWFGIVGADTERTVFYVDDIVLE
jgi:hypothetical protein